MKKPGLICVVCRKVKFEGCERCKDDRKSFKGFKTEDKEYYNKTYNSRRWRQKSISYRKQHPLCVECNKEGRATPAQMVDHIQPIDKGGSMFDDSNLQSLCHKHHNSKSGKSK